jgi:Ni,Fe-hydrogenase III large subunit
MMPEALPLAAIGNGRARALREIPLLDETGLALALREALGSGARLASYFGLSAEGGTELVAVLADDERNRLLAGRARVSGPAFPSIASDFPQAQLFEREIAEQFGLVPEGHPWLKRVRYRRSWTGRDAWGLDEAEPIVPGSGEFYRVEGEQVHEVAVGPVHAGVIEPGHFRFQCHGERVFHLEIALGYQHRGIEEAMIGGPRPRSLHYAETAAGDSTIAHATCYCMAIEALASDSGEGWALRSSARAQAIGAVALELERLANHVGDLGAIAGDVGFLPSASFCGRVRGDFLNMSELVCGSRFGRGLMRPGGIAFDLDEETSAELLRRLEAAERDAMGAINLMLGDQSVLARLEGTGTVPREIALELGLVGPAARASGLARDTRFDQSSGIYRLAQIPVSTAQTGDVLARALVRRLEVQRSIAFIREQLGSLPAGPAGEAQNQAESVPGRLISESIAVALCEGWRGEACHAAVTDASGRLARYKIVDPSFHNWPALAYAMRDEEISDFPLCNKSFNLSYCGHDL